MTSNRSLGIAMVGIGVGGTEMLPAFEQMETLDLVAGADINPTTRERFTARYEARAYDSIEALCEDKAVEAVWISTPNRFHAPHTIYALEHGKHVIVEKPMALNLEEAMAMRDAAKRTGNVLIAGHTRSFIPPFRKMYSVIQSGELGAVRSINFFAYTDWLLRPRVSEELDLAQGGGLVYRQGPHQIDTVAPARRRHGEERPRRRRPVDARAVYPRLLLCRHGVRERRVRHYRARRPRLFHGGAARAVGPRPPTLRRS